MSTGFTKCSHFGEWSLAKRTELACPAGAPYPRRGGKRVDTYGFYPLNSHFLLFLNLTHTRDRRPLRKRERQSDYSAVGAHSVRPFLDIFAVHR